MSSKNKENLRNSREPYVIELDYRGRINKEQLKFHIDTETRQFKIWHLSAMRLEQVVDNRMIFKHTNGVITYRMQLMLFNTAIHISCDCDRKVDRLCHHSYTALNELILRDGDDVFMNYKAKMAKAA